MVKPFGRHLLHQIDTSFRIFRGMGRQVSHNPAASRGSCRWGFFIGNLFGSGGIDPCFGKQLPAVPFAFLKIELSELRNVLSAEEETVAAEIVAFGGGPPFGVFPWRTRKRNAKRGRDRVDRFFMRETEAG